MTVTATVQRLFNGAFANDVRDPRSAAYKAGVLYILRRRVGGEDSETCPFDLGTAEADAWFAGSSEGHSIARDYEGGQ